jgi:hypothetical protein
VNFPEVSRKVSDLKEPFLQLMKKIYILTPYENTIINSFERAIDFYGRSGNALSDSTSGLKRRMKNDIFIMFHKLYPRLHLLSYLFSGRGLQDRTHDLDTVLSVTDVDKPGKRILNAYFDDTAAQPPESENEELPTEKPEARDNVRSKAIRKGLEIMSKLDIVKMRKEFDKSRLFESVSDVDKVFVTYLLFREFDREYSCILTTNKIKFRTDYSSRSQTDFKSSLVSLYDKMKNTADSLKEYAEELKSYEKIRREKPLSNTQYIEFTKRLEAVEKKKNISGKNAIATVRAYMNEVVQGFSLLVEDMNNQQLHIENPQDVLVFDPLIEGEKKINNMKIFEAIYIANCYASAFVYRLSPEGDLSGDLEFKKEEIELIQKQMKDSVASDQSGIEESSGQKSVLEELDDLL